MTILEGDPDSTICTIGVGEDEQGIVQARDMLLTYRGESYELDLATPAWAAHVQACNASMADPDTRLWDQFLLMDDLQDEEEVIRRLRALPLEQIQAFWDKLDSAE